MGFFARDRPGKERNEVGGAVSVIGTAFYYLVGGYDAMFMALITVIVIDYFTGIMAVWYEGDKEKRPSSKKVFKGIVKKVFIITLVGVAH